MQTPAKTESRKPSVATPFQAGPFRCLLHWFANHRPFVRQGVLPRRAETVDKHLLYHDLCAAFQTGSCPICHLIATNTERRLRFLFHECVNDPGVRQQMRAALGFCSHHAEDAARLGNVLGLALLYADLVGQARCRLKRFGSSAPVPVASLCPECASEMADEARYVRALAHDLHDPQMQATYGRAQGLCVPHLEAVLRQASPQVAAFLCEQEEERLRDLAQELEAFARKFDHNHRHEPMGQERDSWRRALLKVAGSRPARKEPRTR